MTEKLKFAVQHKCGAARSCEIETTHGKIQTPVFMPVGTRASVKSLWNQDLEEIGSQIILGNTYHLYLRPGHELIEEVGGGLHGFMNWKRPILTDSGGFQVFSLSELNKITDQGVEFQSHIDGSKHFLSPEKSMEIQKALGSDIVMVFDDCPPLPATKTQLEKSLKRTHNWAAICRDYSLKPHQNLFGIIQGGLDLSLRTQSLETLREMNFEGYALGGLSVGEKNSEMYAFCEDFVPTMPEDKPRYLMGVGKPLDLLQGIRAGIDMFDCVLPTRNARNGQALTWQGPLNIKKARFQKDSDPIDPNCECRVCKNHSRAYIRHLFMVGEYLAGQMLSFHNIYFYQQLMNASRKSIQEGHFQTFFAASSKDLQSGAWN